MLIIIVFYFIGINSSSVSPHDCFCSLTREYSLNVTNSWEFSRKRIVTDVTQFRGNSC